MGKGSAASVSSSLRSTFPGIRLGLVVGICGGVPNGTDDEEEILLGDVIVSNGLVQYDFGRQLPNTFVRKNHTEGNLPRSNVEIRSMLEKMQGKRSRRQLRDETAKHLALLSSKADFEEAHYPGAHKDILFEPTYRHKHHDFPACTICTRCKAKGDEVCDAALNSLCTELGCDETQQIPRHRISKAKEAAEAAEKGTMDGREKAVEAQKPVIHFGLIASGDVVMKSGEDRDRIASKEKVVAFEMEGAGVWDNFPCVVIKGVCDYADSQMNKQWQGYAAATAAACAKAFLREWVPLDRPSELAPTSDTAGMPGATPGPRPCSTVPFRRDLDFIDRSTLLSQIREKCSVPASRTALVGLAGVGKSQLAIEFSYRIRDETPEIWVFWVHASNTARFEEGYKAIADAVKLPGRDEPKADILRLVRSWLSGEANGRWVMILDNADDPTVFSQLRRGEAAANSGSPNTTAADLSKFVPQTTNGSILATSRNKDVAVRLTGSHACIITIESMEEEHALALFQKKLSGGFDKDDVIKLLQALDRIPLTINQAAAYINERAPRITVLKYLEYFWQSERSKASLLNRDAGDLRRDPEASNSIVITWQISFEHIRQARPSAARLLSLLSFFDRQGIPESLLYNYGESGMNKEAEDNASTDEQAEEESNMEFEDDISTLTSYSMININVEGNFEMHRLVQFSARKWLEVHGELEKWKARYVNVMHDAFPTTGKYENWAVCQALYPHAEAMLTYRPVGENNVARWADVLSSAAWYARESKGNYAAAEQLNQRALEKREKVLGKEHLDTLSSVNNLALVLQDQGRYEEAEELHRRALEGREKVLGEEHLNTLISVNNLALALKDQGRYKKADELHRRALEGYKKVLGKEHPHTLVSVDNLALVLQDRERNTQMG